MKKLPLLLLFASTLLFTACESGSDHTTVSVEETETATPTTETLPVDTQTIVAPNQDPMPNQGSTTTSSGITLEVVKEGDKSVQSSAAGATAAQSQKEGASAANDKNGDGCPDDLMCTADFRTISITVKDAAGQPVVLDKVQVVVAGTSTPVLGPNGDDENLGASKQGRYMVATDNSMALLGKAGKSVDFKGYKNGRQIVAHRMVIGHDCCHIKLLKGAQTVVVN